MAEADAADGASIESDDIEDERIYDAPDGARISVIVGVSRLLFREANPDEVVFERDYGSLQDVEPEERPKVVLGGDDNAWSAFYQPKGADVTERISLEHHEGRSGPATLELFGTGSPDVTIEWLAKGN